MTCGAHAAGPVGTLIEVVVFSSARQDSVMEQELWRKVEELFHAALERTPDARQTFLDGICGADIDLRRQVEVLLAKEGQAGSFLEVPAIEDMRVTLTAAGSRLGRQFGPYHIVSPLGAGAMGELYRAHDSKLGRDVAIKTLPHEFARDPERLSRLRREARTLASLNHPHIAAIYGLEECEGAGCLVMELVEGDGRASGLSNRQVGARSKIPPRSLGQLCQYGDLVQLVSQKLRDHHRAAL